VNKFTSLFFACLLAIPLTGRAIVYVDIQTPAPNAISNDIMDIKVKVGYTVAVDTVWATVGN
jgi:hypothetical protein